MLFTLLVVFIFHINGQIELLAITKVAHGRL